MTYWGGLIFSDAANNLFQKTITGLGQAEQPRHRRGDDQPAGDQRQKVAAAVESNTMPDALDMGLDLLLLLSAQKKLEVLDDLYTKIGSGPRRMAQADRERDGPESARRLARRHPVCGVRATCCCSARTCCLTAGLTPPPKTWQDVSDWSVKAQKPPKVYGMGLTLANNGDGNTQVSVLQSFGGRCWRAIPARSARSSPTETKAYLQWIGDAFTKGLFPPGVTTWDGAGDNNSYQSGQAIFIANTGSVYIWAEGERPGPDELDGHVCPTEWTEARGSPRPRPQIRGIPTGGKHVAEVEGADRVPGSQKDFVNAYYKVAIYGPVLAGAVQLSTPSPISLHSGLLDLAQNGSGPAGTDVNNAAYADFNNNYIVPKMIQRIVVDNWDPDQRMDEAQNRRRGGLRQIPVSGRRTCQG